MSPRREEYGRGTAAQRGYGSRWRKVREGHLRDHPLCELCRKAGRTTEATVVDHVEPHRGDWAMFWDAGNRQSLCVTCHSSVKQAEERGGGLRGFDAEGNPLDARHRWNQRNPNKDTP